MSNQQASLRTADREPVVQGQSVPCDVYCIESKGERIWIDPPSHVSYTLPDEDIRRVFYTHPPVQAGQLFPADEVWVGEEDLCMLRTEKDVRQYLLREGCPESELPPAFREWGSFAQVCVQPVTDGEIIRVGGCEFQCIHTPGPTPGHTCLYLPGEQTLFAGALLSQQPKLFCSEQNPHALENLLKSLEKIKELPVQRVFPVWEGSASVRDRADQIIRTCYFRILELLRLVQDHPGLTAYELAGRFSRQENVWKDIPAREKMEAMEETLAYLNYLRERDYVRAVTENDVRVNVPGKRRLTDVV